MRSSGSFRIQRFTLMEKSWPSPLPMTCIREQPNISVSVVISSVCNAKILQAKAQERDAAVSEEELVSDSISRDSNEESDPLKNDVDAPPKKKKRL